MHFPGKRLQISYKMSSKCAQTFHTKARLVIVRVKINAKKIFSSLPFDASIILQEVSRKASEQRGKFRERDALND